MFGFGKISKNKKNNKVRDSICGMSVDKTKTKFSYEFKVETYYFCSENCKNTFIEDHR